MFYSDDKLSLLRRTYFTFTFLLNVSLSRVIDFEDWCRVHSDVQVYFAISCERALFFRPISRITPQAECRKAHHETLCKINLVIIVLKQ